MFEVRQAIVEDSITRIRFACDLLSCKGACCTLPGGKGAPLFDDEIQQLEKAFPIIKSNLPAEHVETIIKNGLFEGVPGSYTTRCFNNQACVFVIYESGIAQCAFERAFWERKITWRKPLSCHLFPIRIDKGLAERLRYEHISECTPALERGKQEQIFLSDFLQDALIRAFGNDWYQEFLQACACNRKSPVLD